jgi:YHS domain-containing protein/uncharacterized membrane protein YraQ (UPF0718 family)
VLVVLLGWQFAAAEFIGGPIMIVLLALTGGIVIGTPRAAAARRHLASGDDHEHQMMAGVSDAQQAELDREPWRQKLSSKAAWSDAAGYTMADLTMLRRELVIGYVIAGFLTVLIPTHLWNDVFLHGHGVWTSVENAIVGPLIAIISFVCSVGNVALAAALWKGGISFGGVISFVFADLITLPLLLIYRKYYGWRLTLRLLAWFWAVMAAAGLAVQGLFSGAGLIPTRRSATIAPTHFAWNYTTILNLVFLGLFGLLYWLYRNRERFGSSSGLAKDPVCGMRVRTADAPARSSFDGQPFWFCSDRCRERFDADPARFASQPARSQETVDGETDPVCGMTVHPASAEHHRHHAGHDYDFCGKGCADAFDADPGRYAASAQRTSGGGADRKLA